VSRQPAERSLQCTDDTTSATVLWQHAQSQPGVMLVQLGQGDSKVLRCKGSMNPVRWELTCAVVMFVGSSFVALFFRWSAWV